MANSNPSHPAQDRSGSKTQSQSRALGFSDLGQQDSIEPGIRVAEFGHIDRLLWDANILFGQNRMEEVRALARIHQEKGLESGYGLAIALLRMDGNKKDFEDLAVEYAVQTGNSPPIWLDAHDKQEKAEAVPTRSMIKVTSLTVENIIETTIKMESPWPMTLDFSEVSKIDVSGLDIFQESLGGRIEREESTQLENVDRLLSNVIAKAKVAPYETNAGLWRFCFNCFRLMGKKDAFDDLAGDFVEKSGEDLPAWKDMRDLEDVRAVVPKSPVVLGFDVGEVLSVVSPVLMSRLAGLEAFKQAKSKDEQFALDFSNVKQWSIRDMAGVVHFLIECKRTKIKISFVNLNEMLFALMKGFSIDSHATLVVAGGTT